MRIWSKVLVDKLPKKQLMAMRYELGDMIKQYPNIKHPLVKFANLYDIAYLGQYFTYVLSEFDKRDIKHSTKYDSEILHIIDSQTHLSYQEIMDDDLVFMEDNDEYLTICYYNLREKYIRRIISDEEFMPIECFYHLSV